jgi:hypothetical protein
MMDRAEAVRVLRAVGTRFRACDYAFFEARLTRGPLSERVRGRSGAWYTIELHVARGDGGDGVRVADVARIRVDGGRPLADREQAAGAIEDRAAARGDRHLLPVLLLGLRRERLCVDGLQPHRARQRPREHEDEEDEQQPNPAVRQLVASHLGRRST